MLKTQIHCKQFKSSTLCNGKGTDMQWDRSEPQTTSVCVPRWIC
jgi:hypothetical protein